MSSKSLIWIRNCLFVLITASMAAGCASPVTAGNQPGKMDLVTIAAPSLAGNQLGDAARQTIGVYLPASYEGSRRMYPVVYYLTGIGAQISSANASPLVQSSMDALMKTGKGKEMILVVISGFNALGGSFYTNSPVSGNWEDFVVKDVVGYIDTHYRTLAVFASRGLAGHSMGGNGAFSLASKHADVFGSLYLLSPGLFDPEGLAESMMFASPDTVNRILDWQAELAKLPNNQAVSTFRQQYVQADKSLQMTIAYGAAYAPSLDGKPLYIAYPYHRDGTQLIRDETIWRQWESGFGNIAAKVQANRDNLAKLNGIVIEYGKQDENTWLPGGCQYLSDQLAAAGIQNTLVTFDGKHADQLGVRMEKFMLPFFVDKLAFQ